MLLKSLYTSAAESQDGILTGILNFITYGYHVRYMFRPLGVIYAEL